MASILRAADEAKRESVDFGERHGVSVPVLVGDSAPKGRPVLARPFGAKTEIMDEHFSIQPQIYFGKPCISGTRIPVEYTVELLQAGISSECIRNEFYPAISEDAVGACVMSMQAKYSSQ